MEKMTLLEKMDACILKENSESKDYFYSHEFKHCGSSLKLLWKVKGAVKKGGTSRSWHDVHACRHLDKGCNEEG